MQKKKQAENCCAEFNKMDNNSKQNGSKDYLSFSNETPSCCIVKLVDNTIKDSFLQLKSVNNFYSTINLFVIDRAIVNYHYSESINSAYYLSPAPKDDGEIYLNNSVLLI
jgi:hypothetical protein